MREADNDYVLLTGRSNPKLAKSIGSLLGKPVLEPVSKFSDMETRVMIPESLRKRNVVIIQPTTPPANEHIMELLLMMDAAKRASAGELTVVIPYYGYARQDRKEGPRVPISSEVVARTIEMMGAARIVTVDLHTEQQQGFFRGPWDNLRVSRELIEPFRQEGLDNLVVASTDHGGIERAKRYVGYLSADGLAMTLEERDHAAYNQAKAVGMIGDVEGKNVLLVDDILDTAGSLVSASELVIRNGAKQVYAAIIHGLFTGPALQRIKDSPIEKLLVTDTVAQREEVLNDPKISVVTVAPYLAEAIRRVQNGISLSADMF